MYQSTNIELAGPLCDCEVENLTIEFAVFDVEKENGEKTKEAGLLIECGTCHVMLEVPPAKLAATTTFSLEIPYPKEDEDIAPLRKKKRDNRKVIPLSDYINSPR